jgi:multiple sugar transport system substrate-binding protein
VAINAGEEGRAVKALGSKYPNATVSFTELPYTGIREKLTTSLDQRSPYDLVMLDDPWFPELAPNLMVLKHVPTELLSDIIPSSLALGYHADGSLRALPFVGNCQLLFYRKDLLNVGGAIDPPKTWSTLLSTAAAIRSGSGGRKAGYCIRGKIGAPIVSDFLPVLWSLGGNLFSEPLAPTATNVSVSSDAMKEALVMYRRLKTESPSGAINFDWTEMTVAFTKGDVAMELNWPAAVKTVDEAVSRDASDVRKWGVSSPPGQNGPGTSMAGNWLLAIPARCDKPDAALDFMLWLMGQQREAAHLGNPPTRRSVYSLPEFARDQRFFHYPILKSSLERATPRPRTPRWSTIEDILSQHVSRFLSTKASVSDATKNLDAELRAALK